MLNPRDSTERPLTASVIIPSYNCAQWVAGAVDSALSQNVADIEVIVVDDGSTDNNAQVLATYESDSRFRYLRQENRGVGAARNFGAKKARGKYLAFVDADDRLVPGALPLVVQELETSGASWCLVNIFKAESDSREVQRTCVPAGDCFYGILREDFIRRGIFFRRADFFDVGGYDETLPIREDWDINIRMFEKKKSFSFIERPLYVYTCRPGSLTKSGQRRILSCTDRVLRKHHKRLADGGDREAARIYAANMWDQARQYLYSIRDYRRALGCVAESLAYDFNLGRLFHPLLHNLSRLRRSGAPADLGCASR